jgi:hypothetical protein
LLLTLLGLKRTSVVVGGLLWQPFDVRFKSFLEELNRHQHNISTELDFFKLRKMTEEHEKAEHGRQQASQERETNAEWRERVENTSEEFSRERELAERERQLMAEERERAEEDRERYRETSRHISSLRSEIEKQKQLLEEERASTKHFHSLFFQERRL